MAGLKPYCPACLDKWAQPTKIHSLTQAVIPRPKLHPSCERALETIRNG